MKKEIITILGEDYEKLELNDIESEIIQAITSYSGERLSYEYLHQIGKLKKVKKW